MGLADTVVAGNDFLADCALRAGARVEDVHVIPTCVDPRRYPVARHEPDEAPGDLVWIGSSSTLRGLEQPAAIWGAVATAVPGLRLRVICDRFPRAFPIPIVAVPWSEPDEARQLAAGQIGVSWLPDDLWSRGKCGLKVLQYQAAGLPVVANPVGCQAEMIRTGEDGFLATTPAEWVDAVRQLADDPGLRRRMGTAARRRVEADYSLAAWSETFVHSMTGGARHDRRDRRGMEGRPARPGIRKPAGLRAPRRPGQDPFEPQTDRPPMSVCTPQERSAIATPLPPRGDAGPTSDIPLPRMFKPPDWEWTGFGEIGWWVRAGSSWRDILLGPDGLRLDEWRASGCALTVKAGPHRVVYRIELPEGAALYQALPGPEPPGDPPPVVPSRQGTQRGQALRSSSPRLASPRSGRSRWANSGSGDSCSRTTSSRPRSPTPSPSTSSRCRSCPAGPSRVGRASVRSWPRPWA